MAAASPGAPQEGRPVLARLVDDRPAFDPRARLAQLPPMDLYAALLFQVAGQQLPGALIIALGRGRHGPARRPGAPEAIQTAYQLDHGPSQQEVLAIAEKWRPYRSLATSYLFSAAFEPEQVDPLKN